MVNKRLITFKTLRYHCNYRNNSECCARRAERDELCKDKNCHIWKKLTERRNRVYAT